jgi:predicted O-linked N-acetylglucosamine transferase (SPINDLY family)
VSPDLREHTVTKFVTGAIEHHERERFELFCYSDAEKEDNVTEKLARIVESWQHTRHLTDTDLDRRVRQDHIDILVDLRGHGAANRLPLFARKPAPVQVSMVGYFNTTGLSTIDYRITDEHMDPPGVSEHLHTEKLVRMPHSCWCYTADDDAPDIAEPPAVKNGFVTFGSLNKIVKVSEPCARLWARVLEAVPNSRLLLCGTAGGGCATKPTFRPDRYPRQDGHPQGVLGATPPDRHRPRYLPVQRHHHDLRWLVDGRALRELGRLDKLAAGRRHERLPRRPQYS